jgi:subtilase family serine protease
LKKLKLSLVATAATLAFPISAAFAGIPYPSKETPKAVDAGALTSSAGAAAQTVTIAMKLHDLEGAQALFQAISTQGNPKFHQFLSTEEFQARFAPTAADVAAITASLSKFGLSVARTSTTTLSVTGSAASLERAFSVSLHQFNVAGHGTTPGYSFHRPVGAVQVPADIAPLVHAVVGLDSSPHFRPHLQHSAKGVSPLKSVGAPSASPTDLSAKFGVLTVTDFANHYNVTPLYNKGITGKGSTLGIVTLANFTPSDAFAYWSAVGLSVDANRLSIVNIDGGPGAPSDASGSGETTLDVEQSGGVAPGAKIIVYMAPNTNQGFLDAFSKAVDSNKADTISSSWGSWEWFDTVDNSPVTDPYSGQTVSQLRAFDEVFLQAALQGQSMFASAGDAGAYDANDGTDGNGTPLLPPYYSLALSVDSPASDPYITAAGGTTLPGTQLYNGATPGTTYTVKLKNENVWSWSYLYKLCDELGYTPITCGVFPVGGGGGVSIEFKRPIYQDIISGPQASQPKQVFSYTATTPAQVIYKLPANFKGRNLPDISANADPDTGYAILYTSDVNGFEELDYYGGTSFVAPQLNGITALLNQSAKSRIGLLNIPLYLSAALHGYSGKNPSLVAITDGDNDFYTGSNGYNPAAGLGILNVANFANFIDELY